MQLISKFNKGISFLLCVIDILSKYAWVIPLNHKESIKITSALQKILYEPGCETNIPWRNPNKTLVGKGNELYNKSMKSCVFNT